MLPEECNGVEQDFKKALGGLLAASAGYASPFLVLGAMSLLSALAMAGMAVPEKAQRAEARDAFIPPHKALPAKHLLASVIGLASMIFGAMFTRLRILWVLLPILAQQRFAARTSEIGLMLTASAVANLAVLPLVTVLARRHGSRFVVLLSTVVTIGALLLLAAGDAVASIWAAAVLLGVGSALALPTLSAYAANAAPPHQIGAAMGLLRTVTDVAVVSGPVVVGALLASPGIGYAGALAGCAAVLIATTTIFAITVRTP